MHDNILTKEQAELLPLIKQFAPQFGLVGGTAIALHLGHRRSIDFDLFTFKKFDGADIRNTIRRYYPIDQVFVDNPNELTVLVHTVKLTFFTYPFPIAFTDNFQNVILIPSLIILAAMKAFALGRRAKWKDYVDLFFIFQKYSLSDVISETIQMFGGEFNEKLFREQLAYIEDVDYSETIDYMPGFRTSDKAVEQELKDISLQK